MAKNRLKIIYELAAVISGLAIAYVLQTLAGMGTAGGGLYIGAVALGWFFGSSRLIIFATVSASLLIGLSLSFAGGVAGSASDVAGATAVIIALAGAAWFALSSLRHQRDSRQSKSHLEALVLKSPDAITFIDLTDTVTAWNPRAEEIFGYHRDEAIGEKLSELIIAEDRRAEHQEYLKQYVETGQGPAVNTRIELAAKRRDGTTVPVELTAIEVSVKGARNIAFIYRDISERKDIEARHRQLNDELGRWVDRRTAQLAEMNSELRRSNDELAQFAYAASHDLQEPLRSITNYIGLLEETHGEQLDQEGRKFMAFAVKGANRMSAMVHDLLDYARIDTERKPFAKTDCELVLNTVLESLDVSIGEAGAIITRDPMPRIDADEIQLTQLFQNLISNAIKYRSEEKPMIHIGAERVNNGQWQFQITDNGIGIEQEYSDRIFVIFQRLHGRGRYEGTGIGLAMCKKIVWRHGGRIWVESEPGNGSTFYFTMPATQVKFEETDVHRIAV